MDREDCLEAVSSLDTSGDFEQAGGWVSGPRFDVIESMDPDFILTSDRLQRKVRDSLQEKGYDVRHFEPESLEEVYKSIKSIGDLLNAEEKAEEVVREMKAEIGSIDLEGVCVYCEEWSDPAMVSGNWIPFLVREIGGKYPIQSGRSREIDMRDLAGFNPEYIFLNTCGDRKADKTEVTNREELKNTLAVKKGNVFHLDDSLLNRPSPKLVEGAKKIEELVLEQQN